MSGLALEMIANQPLPSCSLWVFRGTLEPIAFQASKGVFEMTMTRAAPALSSAQFRPPPPQGPLRGGHSAVLRLCAGAFECALRHQELVITAYSQPQDRALSSLAVPVSLQNIPRAANVK